MFIKPQKVAEFIALWNTLHELSEEQHPTSSNFFLHKYANMNAPAVCRDLEDNHHRTIAHSYLQDVSDWVGGNVIKLRTNTLNMI